MNLLLVLLLSLAGWAARAQDEVTDFEEWEEVEKEKEKEKEKKEEKKEAPKPTETEAAPAPAEEVEETAPEAPKGVLPPLYHRYGSLSIMGVFQSLFDTTFILDDNEDTERVAFSFQRARIILEGHLVSENLRYFFQGDAGNIAGFVLDMFLNLEIPGSGFSVRVGRFVPDFSYMNPRIKSDIAAIAMPAYLALPTVGGRTGSFALWRQIGVEAAYRANPQLTLKLGVFNGFLQDPYTYDPGTFYNTLIMDPSGTFTENWTDNNKAKDILIKAAFKPNKKLSFDMNFWFGFPANADPAEDNDILIMGGPGLEYNDGKLHLIGEFMFRVLSHGEAGANSQTAFGVLAHAGYRLSDLIEGIFRVDFVEPDTELDEDMLMRVTLGPHFWIEEKHFRILVNLYFDLPLEGDTQEEVIGLMMQAALMF